MDTSNAKVVINTTPTKEVKLPTVPGFQMQINVWNMTNVTLYIKDVRDRIYEIPSQAVPGGHPAVYYNVSNINTVKKYRNNSLCSSWEIREITEEVLLEHDHAIYVSELGLIIGSYERVEKIKHPASQYSSEILQSSLDPDCQHFVQLIDNEGKLPNVWFSEHGDIRTVTAIEDHTKPSGIYVNKTNVVTKGDNKVAKHFNFYPMEQILTSMTTRPSSGFLSSLFTTKLELIDHLAKPTTDEKVNAELVKLRRDKDSHEAVVSELKRQHELKIIEYERQQKEYDHASKIDSLRNKDYYENVSHVRKDGTEGWKFLSAAVSAVVLFATILK